MHTRPYEPNDLPAISQIYEASIHGLAAPFYTPEQLAAWAPPSISLERWQQRLAEIHTVVAESEGVLMGFAAYRPDGYLDLLFTHPAYARRGVATTLYKHIEGALGNSGVRTITTHASLAARSFFEKQGFRIDREETVECRGQSLRRFAMHKDLLLLR